MNEIHPTNTKEIIKNISEIPQEYGIVHCILADPSYDISDTFYNLYRYKY